MVFLIIRELCIRFRRAAETWTAIRRNPLILVRRLSGENAWRDYLLKNQGLRKLFQLFDNPCPPFCSLFLRSSDLVGRSPSCRSVLSLISMLFFFFVCNPLFRAILRSGIFSFLLTRMSCSVVLTKNHEFSAVFFLGTWFPSFNGACT